MKGRGVRLSLQRTWWTRESCEPRVLAESAVGGGTTVAPLPTCQFVRKVLGCRWLLFDV